MDSIYNSIIEALIFSSDDPLPGSEIIKAIKEIDGIDAKQICDEFNISHANLWVITHRVRKSMKVCLNKNWGDTYK